MTKVEISKELHEKVTKARESIPWGTPTELDKTYVVAGALCGYDLKTNGLTAQDIYALAIGDYTIKTQFEIGQYYSAPGTILKVISVSAKVVSGAIFDTDYKNYSIKTYLLLDNIWAKEARQATEAEIALFDRAEYFHKQKRKLDDFKMGDIVMLPCGELRFYDEPLTYMLHDYDLDLICPVEKRGDL